MLKDEDRIFQNIYGFKGTGLDVAKSVGDWDGTDKLIAKREKETGNTNPMYTNVDWHGKVGHGPFKSSQEAYDAVHIGSAERAKQLQEGKK